ncbi:MAG TPA: hypothetical protein VEM40_09005 [Nitrospirota bacterium]|nr:hypothetical protein [Nitrospirota bacterium]
MLTYKGGQTVGKGTYWDLSSGRRIDVVNEAVLSGGRATYVRMSAGVMLLSGPLIGLLYAVLMPFVGIASLAVLAVGGVLKGAYDLAVKSVSFGWRPINAYLSGRKKRNAKR